MDHMHGTYNALLVILSYVIAVAASHSALDLAGRIVSSEGKSRVGWLVCGAGAMGLGIWSMHFVAMLAFKLPVPVSYRFIPVLLSVLLAIAVSGMALWVIFSEKLGAVKLMISGTLMAAGISGMHYVGMAAMTVKIAYVPKTVVLSVAIAAVASFAALWLLDYFRNATGSAVIVYKLCSGMIMGAAIAGMHYTGMSAARFQQSEAGSDIGELKLEPNVLAFFIAAGTLILLAVTLAGIYINKRLSQKDLLIQEHEGWYRSLYENNSDGILSVDKHGTIIGFNPSITRITGISADQYADLPISEAGLQLASDLERNLRNRETTFLRENGDEVEISITNVPVNINGSFVGYHIIARDITEEKRNKNTIHHLAFHDELTGLPNRRQFNRLLLDKIEAVQLNSLPFAVIVIDIDRFKMINDSLGHAIGDQFLQMVSERMQQSVADCDVHVARMGGDEFTLLVCGIQAKSDAVSIAERILQAFQRPYRLKETDFYVTASIGIAYCPEHGMDSIQLLKNADTAMYDAKKKGKNGFRIYTNELDAHLEEKLELENDLRKALENNELMIHYQPQISTMEQQIVGVEALVRWNHPKKGLLYPGKFISIAEESGIIYDIGTWVLREACRQMRQWHLEGGPRIPVSVNLSAQQFHQLSLSAYVKQILEETGLEPHYLELEITESMMMDPSVSTNILKELTMSGIRVSLDDFGTGYSSLNYLKQFPIHKLKIDRSFISEIAMNDNDRAIVATIISMARHLKLDVIAEGIETKEQLDILMNNECSEVQGYYFSKPLPPDELKRMLFDAINN